MSGEGWVCLFVFGDIEELLVGPDIASGGVEGGVTAFRCTRSKINASPLNGRTSYCVVQSGMDGQHWDGATILCCICSIYVGKSCHDISYECSFSPLEPRHNQGTRAHYLDPSQPYNEAQPNSSLKSPL